MHALLTPHATLAGEELGDPDCVWKPGAKPKRTEHITPPGLDERDGL